MGDIYILNRKPLGKAEILLKVRRANLVNDSGQGEYLQYLIIIWDGDHPIRMEAWTIRMEVPFK